MFEMIAMIIMGTSLLAMGLIFLIDTIKRYYEIDKEE